jgi:pimeloyl-ACP methyl ester carboxylesterase
MGFSPAGPMPRDAAAIVADLDALAAAAPLRPPYILVGHSAGAMTMRLFADAHPRDIAGMVLVDPSVDGQFDGQAAAVAARVARYDACAVAAEAGALPSAEPGLRHCSAPLPATLSPRMAALITAARLRPGWWRTQASEFAAIAGANSEALRKGRQNYGDLPLIVLTAGRSAEAMPGWAAAHAALAARSTRGFQCTVADAPHVVMNAAPAVVAAAVAAVARPATTPPRLPCASP